MNLRSCFFIAIAMLLVFQGKPVHANTCPVIQISYSENWFPISFDREHETGLGIALDIHRQIFKELNIKTIFVNKIAWKRQLKMLEIGKTDAVAAMNYNKERDKKYLLAKNFYSVNIYAFSRTDKALRYKTLDDLRIYRGVFSRAASFGAEFDQFTSTNPNIHPINGTDKIVQLLLRDRSDYFVLPEKLGFWLIRRAKTDVPFEVGGPPLIIRPVQLAFSKLSPCASQLKNYNKKLEELRQDGTIQAIIDKY